MDEGVMNVRRIDSFTHIDFLTTAERNNISFFLH